MLGSASLFALGLALILAGSELITRNIGPLARAFGVKELVVTILGVSVLTSLPELTVSLLAILGGEGDISVGNVIGSNFVTLTFVTAACALVRPIDIRQEVRERESSWMILSASLVMVLAIDGRLSRSDGVILVGMYVPYILSVLRASRQGESMGRRLLREPRRTTLIIGGLSVLGVLGVVGGAKLALDGGTSLGAAAGISPVTLGVLVFAFGSSLPEFAISMSATLKRKADVTIGEIYASNIFTQLVVLGTCCLVSPIQVPPALSTFAMPLLVLATVVIQIFVTSGARVCRKEALGLLAFYAVFTASQFAKLPSIESLVGF